MNGPLDPAATAAAKPLRPPRRTYVLPAALWLVVTLAGFVVWSGLAPLDGDRVRLETDKVTTMVRSSLTGKLRGQVTAMFRQIERLDRSPAPAAAFEAESAQFLRDFPALLALHYRGRDVDLGSARPPLRAADVFSTMPSADSGTTAPVEPGYTRWLSPPAKLADGRLVYFIVFRHDDAQAPSTLTVALDARRWFGEAFDTIPNHAVQLADGGTVIYRHDVDKADPRWSSEAPLEAIGRSWRIQVTPSHAAVAAITTGLPTLILAGSLALALLIGIATWLVLVARERASLVADARADLDRQTASRRLAEAAHENARRELGSILESITDGFVIVDSEWRYTYANEVATQLSGRTHDELIGAVLWDVSPLLSGSTEADHLRRALREQISVTFERRASDQRVYWVRAYPHLNGLAIYFHDVTVTREIADRLRKNESLLRHAQSIAHIGSFSRDLAGGVERWSEELFRLFGMEAGTAVPGFELLLDRVHPEDRDTAARADAEARAGKAEVDVRVRVARIDGAERVVRIRMRQEQDALGTPLAIAGTVQDVTEQEKAGAALAAALARSQRQSSQFRSLNRAMLLVSAKLGHPDLQQVLVEEMREALHAHLATLHLVAESGPLIPFVSMSDKYARWRHFSAPVLGLGLLAETMRSGKVLRLTADELAGHPAFSRYGEHGESHPPLRGLLSVPLYDRTGKMLGFLQASDRHEGEFSADDEAIAIQFAQIASIAMGWSHLIDDLRQTHASLTERLQQLDRTNTLLAEAERVARLGSWELHLDGEGRPSVMLSEEAARILGAGARIIGPEALGALIHLEDAPRIQRVYREMLGGDVETFDGEFRIGRGDAPGWVHGKAQLIRDAAGKPLRVVGSVQDVTKRRALAEQDRLRAEALAGIAAGVPLDATLASVVALYESRFPDGVCSILLLEPDGSMRTAAGPRLPPAYSAAIDGVRPGPAVGSCGTAAWLGERVVVTDIANDPLWADFAALALSHDLRACWSTPILDAAGRVAGTFAVYYREPRAPQPAEIESVDKAASIAAIAIESHRARQRVEESEQRFRSLFTYVPEAVFALDLAGTIVDCNVAAERMSGFAREALVGQPLSITLRPEDRPGFAAHIARAAMGATQIELHRQRPDGSCYITSSTKTPIIVDGKHVGIFSIVRDITRERANQAALEEALRSVQAHNRELEEFAFVASHDLQEPLRKVRAFGDRLRLHLREAADRETLDYIERMRAAAERMQRLIDDLLAYSRVAKRARQTVATDLGAVLRGVLVDLETHVEQKGARIVTSGELPVVHADETQMRQLLQNLVSNALKFSDADRSPEIHVAGETFSPDSYARRPWVRLTVRDNGIGFDNRYSERIFAPFQRLHGRGEYEGSGIGLAIVRRIVERHGGRIHAEGRPGDGAVFTIELPQYENDGAAAPGAEATA